MISRCYIHHQGATLIEVVFSLFLLTLIMLSVEAMQLVCMRQANAIHYVNIAQIQLRNMTQLIESADEFAISEQYVTWSEQNRKLLPQGVSMMIGRFPHYTLSISWGGMSGCAHNTMKLIGCLRLNT